MILTSASIAMIVMISTDGNELEAITPYAIVLLGSIETCSGEDTVISTFVTPQLVFSEMSLISDI